MSAIGNSYPLNTLWRITRPLGLKQCARHAYLAVSSLPRLPYAPDPKDNWNNRLGVFLDTFSTRKKYPHPARSGSHAPKALE
jgi:hypothetical protein